MALTAEQAQYPIATVWVTQALSDFAQEQFV